MGSWRCRSSDNWSLIILVGFSLMMIMVSGAGLRPSQCMQERRLGVNACFQLVLGQPPSAACCARFRANHLECLCPAITPKLASLFDVNRAILLFKTCGKRVPRHFKCGSIHFP
ncbi:Bifunctional inhibitor/plant lipid transfer protein/seed storage helical domain-containing protein [Melia azedarach]|uniref:Bifunctional inhibitor/plant lipid transfer protein/seed storage helical domain-containing protein n=1 Tax=Melia azedarach TaxID=155640 RepID=A0ACC1XMC6_MELAZ|nr:Bifunctional inhibitor/plant lipid transfer protein/seed storage helical domain-containing protein [Melia azedarach]